MKKIKYIASLSLVVVLLSGIFANAKSYTYNYHKNAVETPEAASVYLLVDDEYSGWGTLSNPTDIQIAENGDIFIADADNKRVVHLDSNYKFVGELSVLKDGEEEIEIQKPQGVFYHAGLQELYIADTIGCMVYVTDLEGNVIRKIKATSEDTFKENFQFLPLKVAVDYAGRVFVTAENVYDGLLEFDTQGAFVGYAGSNKVSPSASDIFWRTFGNKEMKSKMSKLLPVEFDNIDVDDDGFIYTVTRATHTYSPATDNPVRKQTVKGVNILKTGHMGVPIGDYEYSYVIGPSRFVDISVNTDYGYVTVDERRKRLFVYNNASEILFVLGGEGQTKGYFTEPVAVETYEDKIAVLDKTTGTITVFQFTEYGKLIIEAENAYLNGEYDKSVEKWEDVLKKNSSLDIAYVGIGKVLIVKSEYKEAMKYLKMGGDTEYYSKAYTQYRKDYISKNIYWILAIVIVIVALILLYRKFLSKKVKEKNPFKEKDWYKGLKFSKYIMFHPFDGFWDMQHENKGHTSSAFIIYGLFTLVLIIKAQFTGFSFGGTGRFNLVTIIGSAIVPIFLWCVCNWSVTTLFDGDGSPKAIMMATAYSLMPYVIMQVPIVILTNFLSTTEATLISTLNIIAIAWCAFLLFCGMLTIHQYTGGQTILTIIVSIIGMAAVLFLVILLYNLLQQMIIFVISMYNEIVIRM